MLKVLPFRFLFAGRRKIKNEKTFQQRFGSEKGFFSDFFDLSSEASSSGCNKNIFFGIFLCFDLSAVFDSSGQY